MSEEERALFVTFCRKCGEPTQFPMDSLPRTAAELEVLRRRVAEVCPDHGRVDMTRVHELIAKSDFDILDPVAAELRDYFSRPRRPAS